MKRSLTLFITLLTASLATMGASKIQAASFTAGNLVVLRVGDGGTALGTTASAVSLAEYTTATGQVSPVQTISVDSTATGLTLTGSSATQGTLNRSTDGTLLTFGGYRKAAGGTNPQSDTTATTNRVIGYVGVSGSAPNVATAVTDGFSADSFRSVITMNGSSFYLSGAGTSASGGVRYLATAGSATTSVPINNGNTGNPNTRQILILGGNIYLSSGAGNPGIGVHKVGSGLPISGPQTYTGSITTAAQIQSFYFTNLGSGNNWASSGFDTVYTADGTNLSKFSFNGTTWALNNAVAVTGIGNIIGTTSGSTVTLYGTDTTASTGRIFSLTDTAGFNVNNNGSATTLATAGTNYAFRGISFAPVAPVSTPTVTIAATDAAAAELPADAGTFRITRTGDTTNPMTVNYTISTGAGQALAADYSPALTGSATILAAESFVDVTITPVDDTALEGDETVTLTITDTVDYDLGSPITASVTIDDNETAIDLSRYTRVGRYDLPVSTVGDYALQCREASAVTYNWDTDTLFVTGDGGTSVVQVSKTGTLINFMTLATGSSPQGTEFYDTEGITYIGGGQFVMTEERDRQLFKFTYAVGTTLGAGGAQRVKLGTTIGNIGLEGLSYDPQTNGFIVLKEKDPRGLFQTGVDFGVGTATNGSPTTVNSTDLFSPALLSVLDHSDIFALSNLPALNGKPTTSHLILLSQESGQILHLDRTGAVSSTLTIVADVGSPLTVPDMTMEGVTMDRDGFLYVVNENGGGNANVPQLWVYAPSNATNTAPTAITLSSVVNSLPETTNTSAAVKVASISITDDGLGANTLSVSGADASSFEIVGTALFLKATTVLNATTKPTYSITVNVYDTTVGITPDASTNYTLTITTGSGSGTLIISEVAPWSSTNGLGLTADWFEVTNTGTAAVDITGWKVDDNGPTFATAIALSGITSIAAGESVIFVETSGTQTNSGNAANFRTLWFGASPPPGLQIGSYSGSGIGLSSGGDSVNLFNAGGTIVTSVSFGASQGGPFPTFDNAPGITGLPITTSSVVGTNGAFTAAGDANEIGSPGTIATSSTPIISITAVDPNAAEELTNTGTFRITRTGSTASSLTVNFTVTTGAGQADAADYTPAIGTSATIGASQTFVDVVITPVDDTSIEGSETVSLTLFDTGSYDVGSPASAIVTITDNDVNTAPTAVVFRNTVTSLVENTSTAADVRVADITITDDGNGTNTLSLDGADAASFVITGNSLYLKAGTTLSYTTKPTYNVTVNVDDTTVGSTPDATANFVLNITQFIAPGTIIISEVSPWSSTVANSPLAADWFEVKNTGATAVNITGWKVDDNSHAFGSALLLNGITSIAPGESVIFIESAAPATIAATFRNLWFGASPPVGLQIGTYTGSGIGFGSTGDEVVLFNASGGIVTGVAFGASPTVAPFTTFDNAAGAGGTVVGSFPILATQSAIDTNGAFAAVNDANEIGSPGTTVTPPRNDTTITIADASIAEGNAGTTTLNLAVTRSDTLGAFTVKFATSNGTATAGSDYTAATGTLTFTVGGSATQNVSVLLTGDTTVEPNETFIVTLSNVVNTAGTAAITDATGTGTLINDDTTPVVFPASNSLTSTVKGSIALAGAEIPAFDPLSDRAFASSGVGIQVVNLANPAAPVFINTITPATLGVPAIVSNDISSVAVRKGSGANPSVLAAAIINNPKTSAGHVVFLNAATGDLIGHATVGIVPDHIAWTPDGSKLLVCNEGELSTPEVTIEAAVPDAAQGTASIIPVDAAGMPGTVQTADFIAYDAQTVALKAAGVRIFDDGVPSTDFEPEYLAISPDGTKAMVTLQEANAVAVLDIASATFTSVAPLGKKNFSALRADFSDADGMKNPRTGQPVFGLYMPDAIASFSSGGQTYYVTANEGDDRNDFIAPNETTTVNSGGYDLDNTVFSNEADLKLNANLGKLTVSNLPGLRGDTDSDGDIDEILMYGARSFSILDSTGAIVFDSGDMIEMIVASLHGSQFDDGRSDNKGPEPEGVAVATLGARTFAFVGLERSHMTLVFDVTNPLAPTYVTSLVRTGDTNPEGIVVVSESDSPSGRPLVIVTNEVSNTLSVFELTPATNYTLQVLHYYGESGLLGIQTAPIMGAMIDRFDDQYANTLVLAEGDSFIPGPWLIAGADPSLNAVAGIGATALGRPDFAIMNAFGTDASALGNHEFDLGSPVLSGSFFPSGAWVGAQFPFITTNLDFTGDSSLKGRADTTLGGTGGAIAGSETTAIKAKIAPYAVQTISGQKVGIVGATTWDLLTKTSPNGTVPKDDANVATSDLQEVAAYLQGAITALQGLGVNKIILVDQLDTLQRNKDLAGLVSGIDIMVAGGGHERMGDANDVAVGFNGHDADFIADAYPIVTTAADGKPTLIVTTDTEFSYLGRLVVDFDADGVLILPNLSTVINGAYASTEANLQAAYATANPASTIIAGSTIGTAVQNITNALNSIVVAKDSSVFGYTDVYLEGDRVFGRTQEVNQGNITADANAWKARTALGLGAADAVFSLKNGGGIRASLGSVLANGTKVAPLANPITGKPAKGISLLDIENALRFDNKLMVFETTPSGLLAILNYAAGLSSGPTVQNGGYPQVGNIRFSYNSALPAGQKVRSAAMVNEAGHITARIVENGAVLPGAPATIQCVALNFTANGGDGYPIKANADNFRYLLTTGSLSAAVSEALDFTATATFTGLGLTITDILGEQKAFSDFLVARHPSLGTAYNVADTAVALDTRIQQLAFRSDTALNGPATFAAWLAQNGFSGTAGGDTDNDGVPDSLEYFFNSSPNSGGDRDNLPTVTMNGGDLEFRFTYLNSTVFPGFLQCSEDLVAWANATPGVDYEVITETVNGAETSVRFRIFCNPTPTATGPFTYLTPFTAAVGRGAIDQLTITNHGMVGAGRITGEALDSFGETMGAASGLSITGWSYNSGTGQFNGTFNVLPDRGYNSGAIFSNYAARVHQVPFTFVPYYGAGPVAQTQIVPTYNSTTKFTYLDGITTKFTTGLNAVAVNTIMGQSVGTAPAANGPGGATENLISFDAEAIHVFADGSGFVSDEYGAYLARFNSSKQFTKLIQLPAAAQPHKPFGTLNYDAVTAPTNGRRNNQGLEGLSVSPDNSRLFALLQSATIQDGAAAPTRYNTRLFVYDIAGANVDNPVLIGEYAVQLPRYDLNGNGSALDTTAAQSEVVALSNTQFLMLPRDGNGLGKGTTDPIVTKTVDLVDFSAATNVLGLYDGEGNQISPGGTLRATITPAKTTVVVNLLSSADLAKFGFNTNTAAPNQFTVNEKMEGMSLVPDTSTASTEDYFLFVANDNDFQSSDVRMVDAAGTLVTYGDARDRGITNDAVFTAWRITICPNNRKFFRIQVNTAP